MSLFDVNSKLRKWKYTVKNIQLSIPGEENIVIPNERMKSISIMEDYEALYFPLFKIELILESEIYYKIIKNKNRCKIHLRIDRYFHSIDNSEKSAYRKFINSNFDLIIDEDTDDMQYSLKQEENKLDYENIIKSDMNELNQVDTVFSFYLFNSDIIDGTKKNVNKVLSNCNIVDAIAWIASTGKIKNLLMGQPDNIKIYDELLIPKMSILRALEYLDSYFGLYQKGSMIYFGLDYTYILPYTGKCKAYVNNEITDINMVVPKSSNLQYAHNCGELFKGNEHKKHYIVCDHETIDIRNDSISNNYLVANDIETIDSYTGESETFNTDAISKKGNFVRVHKNNTENPYIGTIYTAQTGARSKVVVISTQDYNIMDIAPNKQYSILFEDMKLTKKHNGLYILCNVNHSFIKEGEDFALRSIITFKLSTE